ncbi:Retrovirus-related Pol polyprotein from transposon TNT 1-94 [Vitis vinifera]|uniref:Retrovirus-related Pol polyprotein from transposon TNT 1-94 n=1 Tax=Vitis vinifera TaxID=29760 RepID=A0A438HGW9_VITVI|nr:Retrovirus-related Pol polyprotein from transposon TNT 1-94 [Vitis vinifera]
MRKVPYTSAMGSLMYAMVCTRLDIAHVVGVVSKFLFYPGKEHWGAVKWILRYMRGTSKTCLCFGTDKHVLEGCTDVDMARDVDSKKSTSGYLITFQGEQCHGNQSCRNVLHCRPQRLSIFLSLKLARSYCG